MGLLHFLGGIVLGKQPIPHTKSYGTIYRTDWSLSKADINLRANKRKTSLFKGNRDIFPSMGDYIKKR